MEITRKHIEMESYRDTNLLDMKPIELLGKARCSPRRILYIQSIPHSAIANPTATVKGPKIVHREGCLSLPDMSAHVPRSSAVEVGNIYSFYHGQ